MMSKSTDLRACISANKPSFQNPTKNLFAQCSTDAKSAVLVCLFVCKYMLCTLRHIYGALGKKAFCQVLKIWLNG